MLLIWPAKSEWVPNGPSEQPQRKPGVRETFRASCSSSRCTAIREKRRGSWASSQRSADRETVRIGRLGGGSGIRTHGTLARTTVFETAPFDRSGIPPSRGVARTWVLARPDATLGANTQVALARPRRGCPRSIEFLATSLGTFKQPSPLADGLAAPRISAMRPRKVDSRNDAAIVRRCLGSLLYAVMRPPLTIRMNL